MNEATAPVTRGGRRAATAAVRPEPPPTAAAEGALRGALLDSRQRWRDLVTMAADIAFETDAAGRLVFVSPDPALGWAAGTLLGQPATLLLADAAAVAGFDPFRAQAPVRGRRAWLKRPNGQSVCLTFAVAPLLDAQGQVVGSRGVGQDMTEQDGWDARVAAALRRGEVLDHILSLMRQEVLAPRMMQATLQALIEATGAEGAAVIDMLGDGVAPTVLHHGGRQHDSILHPALLLLEQGGAQGGQARAPDGRPILVCPNQTRFGAQTGLVMWRAPDGRGWDDDDAALVGSATGIARVILEHESIQLELSRQARTDPLTGLLNRRAFLDEVVRRIDRLEREEAPGTLMFIDLDHFKRLNDGRGHDVGDEALCTVAGLLRDAVRPSDLVARLGGDEFALWLDGADELAAAERAEGLRVSGPRALAHLADGSAADPHGFAVSMSIGIATRWPGRGEDLDALINRADQAMYEVKRAGRAHWRVSRLDSW